MLSECVVSSKGYIIVEIIDNPLFNTQNLRESEEYLKLSAYIRGIIKKGWKL
jgi:NitT/TauT family transport system ATP-binding protein